MAGLLGMVDGIFARRQQNMDETACDVYSRDEIDAMASVTITTYP